MPEEESNPWDERIKNPLYVGPDAGTQTRLAEGEFDHFIFAVKCNLASRIFEYSGSDYYGELFPLLARLFAVVDKRGQEGGDMIATDELLMVPQVKALVEAASTAVQMPMLVDLGRKSLTFGPTGSISGPAFFGIGSPTTGHYVDFSAFNSHSKTSLYNSYIATEDGVISDICFGAIDIVAETGIAVEDERLLRKMPQLAATATSTGSELSKTEKKMLEVHAFVVRAATERFYTGYSPAVIEALEGIFCFYSVYGPLMAEMLPVAQNWVVREGVAPVDEEDSGIAFVHAMINRMD